MRKKQCEVNNSARGEEVERHLSYVAPAVHICRVELEQAIAASAEPDPVSTAPQVTDYTNSPSEITSGDIDF